jgi:hypothetical protein
MTKIRSGAAAGNLHYEPVYALTFKTYMTFSWTSIVQLSGSTRAVPAAVYYSTFNAYKVAYVCLTPCWDASFPEPSPVCSSKTFNLIFQFNLLLLANSMRPPHVPILDNSSVDLADHVVPPQSTLFYC